VSSVLVWVALTGLAAGVVRAAWQSRRRPAPNKPRAAARKERAKAAPRKPPYLVRGYPATAEQARAIDLALTRDNLKIEAAAGSGKTSTLVGIAEALSGKGLYLAFNRAIACPHTTRITQSFRFGPAIAGLANAVLREWLSADLRVRGNPQRDSRIGRCEPEAILCRTNAEAVATALAAAGQGRRVGLVGGVGDALAQLRAARELKHGRPSAHPDFAAFRTWDEFEARAESHGAPLLRLCRRVDLDQAIDALQRLGRVEESRAELVVTTAHKSKGREWGRVRLADEFRHPDGKGYSPEEANLLYVAITRAKDCLDIDDCEAARKAAGKASNPRRQRKKT